jgi:hypothetical protein
MKKMSFVLRPQRGIIFMNYQLLGRSGPRLSGLLSEHQNPLAEADIALWPSP